MLLVGNSRTLTSSDLPSLADSQPAGLRRAWELCPRSPPRPRVAGVLPVLAGGTAHPYGSQKDRRRYFPGVGTVPLAGVTPLGAGVAAAAVAGAGKLLFSVAISTSVMFAAGAT